MFEQSGPDEQGLSVDSKRFVGASFPKASSLLRRIHNTQTDNNRVQESNLKKRKFTFSKTGIFPDKNPIKS